MKKLLIPIAMMLSSVISLTASAATGDVKGVYYATDIKTYLNGAQIESINIGGDTLISAEAMKDYGFKVKWHPEERMLTIYESTLPTNTTPPFVPTCETMTGIPIGYYYETDIITYLNDSPITAYNTEGKTYIHAEAMREFGYNVKWLSNERKLVINSLATPETPNSIADSIAYSIPISVGKPQIDAGTGAFSIKYTKDSLIGVGDADYLTFSMSSSGKGYDFTVAFYQNEGLFWSEDLMDKLRQLCYDGFNIDNPTDKADKYELVNQNIQISINGYKANKISVTSGAGNGHRDFYITAEDLPVFEKDQINEIIFTVGNPTGTSYELSPYPLLP